MAAETDSLSAGVGSLSPWVRRYLWTLMLLSKAAMLLAPPIVRIALALPFLRSGLTRWDGILSLSPSTTYLFEEMFRLHILGGEYPIPFPGIVAYVVAVAELALPALLLLGLGTRLAGLGLLLMTGVIQLVVPDGWVNFHLYWAALALTLIAVGGGPISLDWLFARVLPTLRLRGASR